MNETLLFIAVGITLCFAFVNGFHDGGNVVATIIGSRSMRPVKALFLGALAEFCGAMVLGRAVAQTVAEDIFRPQAMCSLETNEVLIMVIAAVGGALVWKLITWFPGLPSSSSHSLIGGLIGAGLVSLGSSAVAQDTLIKWVVLPMLLSPIIGFLVGDLIFSLTRSIFANAHRRVGRLFTALQKPSMVFLAASHGSNDAQKSMGVIAMALCAGGGGLQGQLNLPQWVAVSCAAAIALGLSAAGWRVVKTVGYDIFRLEPIDSFAAQFSATSVLLAASLAGGPVSTAQVVTSSVMGVGASRRPAAVRWSVAGSVAYAWLLTLPVCGVLGAGGYLLLKRLILG